MMFSYIKDLLKYSVQYACITHCFFEYVGDFVVCSGPSMEPTLYSNNILLTERISTRFHKPKRGDVIIAISPTNADQYICKRIVGVPGDKICVDKPFEISRTNQNDNKISNDSIVKSKSTVHKIIEDIVPRGYVWIEGDNRQNSSDSRYYGPIPLGLIKSRAICRIWPLNDIKIL
ncbi:mitochondrial inner membrane protease subunit 1 [Glossina fuscipes]|uniref:Mitochondrial inner membrane protease subunit n=1 Tax=Glossina fuscipes TaxID=7396 RepID=A0A9C5ZBI1_9MUSC|nr:mitochondrial inner membrane protease subunit 1 [Glossina fuscipes]